MRAIEFLIEEYDPTKARVPHPEDEILIGGSAGAKQAIAAIKQMATNPETISIKPDGKPALVWGRDEQGFALVDKHMFKAGTLPRSPDQLAQIYSARKGGGREDLISMMAALWPQFEASVPNSFRGWLFGDLLWSQTPAVENNNFVFKPNTVVYTVPTNSDLGQGIARSTSGICVHTFFPKAPGKDAEGNFVAPPGRHISKLPAAVNNKGPLLMITDQFTVPPKVKLPVDLKSMESFITANAGVMDKFLDEGTLSSLKIKDLPSLLQAYGNYRVKQRNFDNFGSDFLTDFLASKKVSAQKLNNIQTYIQENRAGYKVLCQAFVGIMRVKDHIVGLLDAHPAQMQAHINGEAGQEGYLVHTKTGPFKAVNREKFSAANFEH